MNVRTQRERFLGDNRVNALFGAAYKTGDNLDESTQPMHIRGGTLSMKPERDEQGKQPPGTDANSDEGKERGDRDEPVGVAVGRRTYAATYRPPRPVGKHYRWSDDGRWVRGRGQRRRTNTRAADSRLGECGVGGECPAQSEGGIEQHQARLSCRSKSHRYLQANVQGCANSRRTCYRT